MTQLFHPPRNIVLVGFMGCGKSTVGRAMGKLMRAPVIDVDQQIVQMAGMSIPRIFAEHGEEAFRQLETNALRKLTSPGELKIIATGGGVVTRECNRALLREIGYVVWLRTPMETVLERTSRNRNRPLLQVENPRERIQALMNEREPLYGEVADLIVDTQGLHAEDVAYGTLESIRYHCHCQFLREAEKQDPAGPQDG